MSEFLNAIISQAVSAQALGFYFGVPAGVIASILTVYFLKLIKPKIDISDFALIDNESRIRIKMINRSNRQVVGIKATIEIFQRSEKGLITKLANIQTDVSEYAGMDGKHTAKIPWNMPFAYTFLTAPLVCPYADIHRFLQQAGDGAEKRLGITYSYTDALSGTTIVCRQTYTSAAIKRGRFGNNFQIIE